MPEISRFFGIVIAMYYTDHDGVRINIRPFMSADLRTGGRAGAGVLRAKPKIAWNKDRGKEALKPRKRWKPDLLVGEDDVDAGIDDDVVLRPRDHYPWFRSCPGDGALAERTDFAGGFDFDGNRWNDLHYTNAVRREARLRARTTAVDEPSGYRSSNMPVHDRTAD